MGEHRILLSAAALVAASFVVVATPMPAGAANFVVTTTADVVNGADGVTSLREAFAAANANGADDTIQLAASATYQLTSCAAGVLEHTEDQSLTIEANGSTIEQTCADTGVLSSTGFTSLLRVVGATIDGGPNTGVNLFGAGIYHEGNLELDGTTVTGVDSGLGSVVDGNDQPNPGTTLTMTDAAITGNVGNAVRLSRGSVFVGGSTISANTGNGLGLTDGSPVTITESLIDGNGGIGASTTGMGGTQLTISETTITDNAGGGVSCNACGLVDIDGSTITGNGLASTVGTGGGVSMTVDQDDPSDAPRLEITNSFVDGNTARRVGGGVRVGITESVAPTAPSTLVTIANSTVSGNETLGDGVPGGGIAIQTGSLALSGVEVNDNQAGVGAAAPTSHGGGIFFEEAAADQITDPHDLQWGAVEISGNTANGRGGGVALATAGRIEATQITLSDNDAATIGGGGYLALETFLDDSVVAGNAAPDGGGVYLDRSGSGSYFLDSTTISANTATGDGGGVYVEDPAAVTAVNATVTGNSAARGGGFKLGVDPMDEGAPVLLDHVTLTANTAASGANVAVDVGELQLRRSIVAEPLGGGASCEGGAGGFAPVGRSFLSDATCGVAASDTVSAAGPALGPLTANGGLTPTRLPDAASPVGGLIPLSECTVAVDQRNVVRPQGAACEPGAVEIVEAAGPAPLLGTPGNDVLAGTDGDDEIRGLAGNDLLSGGPGDDLLIGGDGADVLIGGPGADVLRGGPGVDLLIGGPGLNTFDGGPGRDLCFLPGSLLPRDC